MDEETAEESARATGESARPAEEPVEVGEAAQALELAPALKLSVCVGGDERHARRPLFREVLNLLRECGVGGATVTRGVLSFGGGRRVHSDMNEVTMENLPFVVEAVGPREAVESAAARVAELLAGRGLVQLQPTALARPASEKGDRRAPNRVERGGV
jgi:PII-like signaling protein